MTTEEADRRAILAVLEQYRLAVVSNDVDAALDAWADDMIWMRQNEPEIIGKQASAEVYRASMSKINVLEYNMDIGELVVFGDWAFHRVNVTNLVEITYGAPPVIWNSKSIIISRRQDDGGWKMARAITNANTAEGRTGFPQQDAPERPGKS